MRPRVCLAVATVALVLAAPATAETYKWRVSGSVTGTYSNSHSWVNCRETGGVSSFQEQVDLRAKLRSRSISSYTSGDLTFGTSQRVVPGGSWRLSGTHTPRLEDPITGEIVCGDPTPVSCGGDVEVEPGATLGLTVVKRGRSFLADFIRFGHYVEGPPRGGAPPVCTPGEGGALDLGVPMFGLLSTEIGAGNPTGTRIKFPIANLTREKPFSVTGTPALPDPEACERIDFTACTQSGRFVLKLMFKPEDGLTADAGGPYTALRGRPLHLDGSRSSPRARIDSYRWSFQRAAPSGPPAPPPPGVARRSGVQTAQDGGCRPNSGGKKGKAPTVVPLCTIKATLTVSDGGKTDSDTTTIAVDPRDWQTPVVKLKPERDIRWGQPQHGAPDGSTFGLNIPGCRGAARSIRDSYFCPLPDGDTWLGDGYTLDIVEDPKGPHDGDWYVKSRPKFEIRRRALVNAYLYAGAGVPEGSRATKEFYVANREAGFPIDDFIRYVENHEGLGQGTPRSGHTQEIEDAIRMPPGTNDPQRAIESVVEPTEPAARKEADQRLRRAGEIVCLNTRDPLAEPWTRGSPLAWDPTFQDFRPLEGADFEGDPRDCAG
jgi:hypothetical protein